MRNMHWRWAWIGAAVTMSCLTSGQVMAQGVVTAVIKDVKLKHRGGDWVKATVGAKVNVGDRVRTGRRSKCEVKMAMNTIRISQRTDITIQQGVVRLNAGTLHGDFNSPTQIRGGQTTATIKGTGALATRGTDWGNLGPDGNPLGGDAPMEIHCTRGGPITVETGFGGLDLYGGQMTTVSPGQPPTPPVPTPGDDFAGGQENPDTNTITTGTEIEQTTGTEVQVEIRTEPEQIVVDDTTTETTQKEAKKPVLTTPELQFPHPPVPPPFNEPTGGTLGSARQMQNYFAPHFGGDAFLFARDGSGTLGGFRALSSGFLSNHTFWSVSAQPQTLFREGVSTRVTDAYFRFRDAESYGDVVVGRQRFLKGPIQNTVTGTLVRQEIMDAITWSPNLRRREKTRPWSLDVSLLQDADPFNTPGDQYGYYVRLGYTGHQGVIAGNFLKVNGGGGSGFTLDVAFPAVPGIVELYGEFGSDVSGNNIATYGAYVPWLYDNYDVDLYIESTGSVGAFPGITIARAYKQIHKRVSVLATVDKIQNQGGLNFGAGLIFKIFER